MVKVIEIVKKGMLRQKTGIECATNLTSKDIDILTYNSNLLLQAPGNDMKKELAKLRLESQVINR